MCLGPLGKVLIKLYIIIFYDNFTLINYNLFLINKYDPDPDPNHDEFCESFGRILLEGKFITLHVKFLREMRLLSLQYALIKPFEIT